MVVNTNGSLLQQVSNTHSLISVHHSSQHHPAQLLDSLKREDVVKKTFRCQLYKCGAVEVCTEDKVNDCLLYTSDAADEG